jgi:hypothetical protein
MTRKLGTSVVGLQVAADRRRGQLQPAALRRNDHRLVAVDDVLFAEMDDPDLASAFADAEIDRLASIFGLTPGEVAELYRPATLTPAAADAPHPRRGRSTRAR